MSAAPGASSINVLLIEPDGLVRSTVASVCRELDIVRIHQATSLAMGEQWLQTLRADGLMLSLADPPAALLLLGRLRAGEFVCEAGIPVVVMAAASDEGILKQLKRLGVLRFLLQPFKLRDVVRTVEQLWPKRGKTAA